VALWWGKRSSRGEDRINGRESERGLNPTTHETLPNGVRKVTYSDPDGNVVGFGGAPAKSANNRQVAEKPRELGDFSS
jgi:hypothetical protein